jgi:hypothetical protein
LKEIFVIPNQKQIMKNLNPLFKNSITVFVVALLFLQTKVVAQCSAIASGSQVISMNLTLTGGTHIFTASTITIKAFTTLTLDAIDCQFYQGSTVFLEQQAKLIIKNGSILRGYCSGTSNSVWAGIRVIGDPSMPATTTSQGYVEITNSIIKDAEVAVLAYEGGLVKATSSQFLDNLNSLNIEGSNQAYPFILLDCDFRWVNRILGAGESHVILNNINGISVLGCSFKTNNFNQGIGILSNHSSVVVSGSGSIIPNSCPATSDNRRSSFEGLNNAIYINSSNNSFNISMSDFLNNTQGIRSSGNITMLVDGNTFTTNDDAPHDQYQGYYVSRKDIYVFNSLNPYSTIITNNDFLISRTNGFLPPSSTPGHIIFDACSFSIDILKNNFISTDGDGWGMIPVVIQDHSAVPTYLTSTSASIFCNSFEGYGNDILFKNSVGFNIGYYYSPANNIFSDNGNYYYPSISLLAANSGLIQYYKENPLNNYRKEPMNSINTAIYSTDYGMVRNCTRCVPDDNYCPDCKTVSKGGNTSKERSFNESNSFLLAKSIDNPNTFTLVSRTSKGKKLIELYDLSGRLVYKGEVNIGESVSFSSINKGLYVYKVKEDSKIVKVGKILIE